jgi:hypothetical protein
VAQVVEHLTSKSEALSSDSNAKKKKSWLDFTHWFFPEGTDQLTVL